MDGSRIGAAGRCGDTPGLGGFRGQDGAVVNELQYCIVNAFADGPFGGNPAAVCVDETGMSDDLMRAVAVEFGTPATAFLRRSGGELHVRWFTPLGREIEKCGHGAIASAHVAWERGLSTAAGISLRNAFGTVTVLRCADGLRLSLDAQPVTAVTDVTIVSAALGGAVPSTLHRGRDLVAVFGDAGQVAGLRPVAAELERLDAYAVVAVAPSRGDRPGYVCRFLKADKPDAEDPVNGACQAAVAPLMAGLLGTARMDVRQVSRRGGSFLAETPPGMVYLTARCFTASTGMLRLP